jgi:cobyrinic acid a,c-diamide synthase
MLNNINSLCISAPSSGSGKTIITAGLILSLRERGYSVSGAKVGPDYIDKTFLSLAANKDIYNLDSWAMSERMMDSIINSCLSDSNFFILEGVMGLFDGSITNEGSTASLVQKYKIPVVLVVDASGQGQSIGALCQGFINYNKNISIVGIILNRVSSLRHEKIITDELDRLSIKVFGSIPKSNKIKLQDRHLGIIPAQENDNSQSSIREAADLIEKNINLEDLIRLTKVNMSAPKMNSFFSPNLGQHISIAKDEAFCFVYEHMLKQWKTENREISFFSPLSDEPPSNNADGIFLPGGYPELFSEKLSNNHIFKKGMEDADSRDKAIYGECGGYMVLGKSIINKMGEEHNMLNMLNLVTSFKDPKLHLGYRRVQLISDFALGSKNNYYRGHEFHYSNIVVEEGPPLFSVCNNDNLKTENIGLISKNVMGSFVHLIDKES